MRRRNILLLWVATFGVAFGAHLLGAQPARASGDNGRSGFVERRARGIGRFLDSTQIRKLPAQRASSLIEGELNIFPVQPPGCRPATDRRVNCVSSSMTRVAVTRGTCALKVMIDGMIVGAGGALDTSEPPVDQRHNWLTAFDLSTVSSADLDMVEIYRQENEVPAEYHSTDTQCGLLLLWTRE